ncbi:hypothetical protein K7432_008714 [Basidiobolus ranarum]|uniref:Uncharacterized protein n=1 Tax=Basidiobolus ranarum TaxID=34480 RepID=A0ABR2WRN1_9FUNG
MKFISLSFIATLLAATTLAQTPVSTTTSSLATASPIPASTTSEMGVFPSIWNKVTSGIASVPSNVRNATSDVFGNSGERLSSPVSMVIMAGSLIVYQLI